MKIKRFFIMFLACLALTAFFACPAKAGAADDPTVTLRWCLQAIQNGTPYWSMISAHSQDVVIDSFCEFQKQRGGGRRMSDADLKLYYRKQLEDCNSELSKINRQDDMEKIKKNAGDWRRLYSYSGTVINGNTAEVKVAGTHFTFKMFKENGSWKVGLAESFNIEKFKVVEYKR